ncbi:MAG: hypothetical protein AAF599_04140 [Bacteroidota bacterium]
MSQIITISFFKYEGFSNKWWAFTQMQRAYGKLKGTKGLGFHRMLGSGGDRGFSIFPNWSTYGLIAVWEKATDAEQFFQKHSVFKDFLNYSQEHWTVYLKTSKVHGEWSGTCPFKETISYDKKALVGVLTRATIHTKYLRHFWKFVPSVSESVHDKKGLIFSVGVGELPIVQQATFSLWESSELMMEYAYKSAYHKEVVQKTRELGWYKEEMFARFLPYRSEGSWGGVDLLAQYL